MSSSDNVILRGINGKYKYAAPSRMIKIYAMYRARLRRMESPDKP